MACFTTSPATSGTNITSHPSTVCTAPTTIDSDCSELRAPLGRPKWASSRTLAPLSASSRTVGTAARTRVSSVTAPSCIGRLRSTRTSATLPVRSPRSSPRSSSVRNLVTCISRSPLPQAGGVGGGREAASLAGPQGPPRCDCRLAPRKSRAPPACGRGGYKQLAHRAGRIDHAVREAPLVVVPAEHAHQLAFEHRGLEAVDGRAVGIVVEIDRDQRLVGVAENALERALRRRLEQRVDFFHRGVALGRESQVDHRDVGCRHADRRAVELALELGQDFADRAGGAGGGRDHRHAGGAGAARVLVDLVEDLLVVGIGVDRRHQAALDADRIVQHLGERREAVGRAAGVRDDRVLGGELVVVDAEHDRQVDFLGRGRDQHPLGAGIEVLLRRPRGW